MVKRAITILVSAALIVLSAQAAYAENIGGAGDISNPPGGLRNDAATARLLGTNGIGLVQTYGDNQYECGELENFQAAYDTTWGQFKGITRPAPGNHEYLTDCAPGVVGKTATVEQASGAGYYDYFADRTVPHPGNYSYDWQGWHFVVINTTFATVPGGAAAVRDWLKADLRANRDKRCTVVYGHHPYRATASPFTGSPDMRYLWPTMVLEDVDLYISGHNHSYERGKPMRTGGNVDYDFGPGDGDDGHMGVRWIVAGTGGRSLIPFTGTPPVSSAVRIAGKYGILKIVPDYVAPNSFLTAFKGADGTTMDRVSWGCH